MTKKESQSDNYISDIVYNTWYNQYLNPLYLHYTALYAGTRKGNLASSFNFCDLGCGDGTTLNLLASMYPAAKFYGVDFNKEHITKARDDAAKADLNNLEYYHLDFANMDTADFPKMEFITCYGTFSWINRSLQDEILHFVGQLLVDTGVFSVHYAAKPGKTQIDPLWHLMRMLTGKTDNTSKERARVGVEAIGTLMSNNARFFKENPVALARANQLAGQDLNYLAHEALTEWQAFYHSEIAERLQVEGLRFAGSLLPGGNNPDFTIPEAFKSIMDEHTDPIVRATIEDYIVNKGLRNDVFVKTECLSKLDASNIHHQPMLLNNPDGKIAPVVRAASGRDILFQSPLYQAMAVEMQQGICTVSSLHSKHSLAHYSEEKIADAMVRLVDSEQVALVIGKPLCEYNPGATDSYRPALKITERLLSKPIPVTGFTYLPSSSTGHCIPVDQIVALCLSAALSQPDIRKQTLLVKEQINKSGIVGIQGVARNITQDMVENVVNQAMQMTTGIVLPILVRLGVYK